MYRCVYLRETSLKSRWRLPGGQASQIIASTQTQSPSLYASRTPSAGSWAATGSGSTHAEVGHLQSSVPLPVLIPVRERLSELSPGHRAPRRRPGSLRHRSVGGHLARIAWHATGLHKLEGLPNGNVTSSTDLIRGARGLDELTLLCVTLRPVWHAFGQALKLVDPVAYEQQRATVRRIIAKATVATLSAPKSASGPGSRSLSTRRAVCTGTTATRCAAGSP